MKCIIVSFQLDFHGKYYRSYLRFLGHDLRFFGFQDILQQFFKILFRFLSRILWTSRRINCRNIQIIFNPEHSWWTFERKTENIEMPRQSLHVHGASFKWSPFWSNNFIKAITSISTLCKLVAGSYISSIEILKFQLQCKVQGL